MIYIIAECALEHKGSVERAKQLIDVAIAAGADAVKFQYFFPEGVGKIWNKIEKFRLDIGAICFLKSYAEALNIDFLCSAFDVRSLENLAVWGLKTVKIPSPCLTNYQMLDVAGELFTGIILSTGLHNLQEVKKATEYLNSGIEPKSVAVLQCTSSYPCPMNEVNLKAMLTLRKEVNKAGKFGISDHSIDTVVPVAATALGADVIEKHITLDRRDGGPDSVCSLEPKEFMAMIRAIRDTELALGNGVKEVQESEKALSWRRSSIK